MMYLENPRSTERDNQNALRKYPFTDAASCGNGACVIPPGALVDAQLYVPGRTAGPVWLSLADEEGRLHFSDASGEFAVTSQPVQPLSAVPVTFTGDGGQLPGGVVVCGREGDVASLLSAGRQSFARGQAELAPAAVTFTGARGVTGFRLDDGNTVWGAVRIRGANGCDVATYVKDGKKYLRISAIGQTVTDTVVTGFITRVVAESNNESFTVSPLKNADGTEIVQNRCVLVSPTGAKYLGDDDVPYDQEDACAAVKKARGTLPSGSATIPPNCGDICDQPTPVIRTITLKAEGSPDRTLSVFDGDQLPSLTSMPVRTGLRCTGYFKITDPYDSVVEYVEATGSQYVDLDLVSAPNTCVEWHGTIIRLSTNGGLWCCRKSIGDGSGTTCFALRNRELRFDVASVQRRGPNVSENDRLDILQNETSIVVNGTVAHEFEHLGVAAHPLICFASYLGHTGAQLTGIENYAYVRLREMTVRNGTDVVRNLIPVRVGTEGALFDTVSGRVFKSAEAPLICGPDTAGPHTAKYYSSDGAPVKRTFTDAADITLYAHWVQGSSSATATFDGYGTLHLLAPDTVNYSNPLRISGGPGIVPQVRTMTPDELAAGGSDALGELILHPATAAGEVHLSLRGLQKAFDS